MRHLFTIIYGRILNLLIKMISASNAAMKLRYMPGFNGLRHHHARVRAYLQFIQAAKRVPAYRDFLQQSGFKKVSFGGITPIITQIPAMTKQNYISRYTLDERCVGGAIPDQGVIVDESSGSSGKATNWVRGHKEREANMRLIEFGLINLVGKEPIFSINAFALGAWATGVNITMSCLRFTKIKSTGPDKAKIINTLKHFGTAPKYVIMGYPPFLKQLVDSADINWKDYRVTMMFGGEPMSEGMRDYLISKGIKQSYSSFGASDLELNIAHENDFTIALRRLLREKELLAKKLLRYDGALPMIFQFNPGDFLIETNEKGELLFTICRPDYIAPKIRYNLFDRGYVLQMAEIQIALKELGLAGQLMKPQTDLPLLFHYGRADLTVAFFGANISPNDIQETIYKIPELAGAINSYCLNTTENANADKQLIVSLEIAEGQNTQQVQTELISSTFFDALSLINQDFRAAYAMAKESSPPQLIFYHFNTGPFVANDIRIKQNYLM